MKKFMSKFMSKFIALTICIIITATGASLALTAAVGVGAWDALSQSISSVLGMKVGTFSMILNISCVLIQIILLKKEFKPIQLLQIFVAVLLGFIINFMYYDVFSHFDVDNYFVRLILLVLSQVICAIGVSSLMIIDFISFPLESCCMVVSKRINKNFGLLRQFVDIASIIIALAISLIFRSDISVREGTVIGMLTFGPMLNLFMKTFTPVLRKLNIVEEDLSLNENDLELAEESSNL